MNILITGGAGFLGKYILKELIDQGYQVTSLSRGYYPELEALGVHTIQADLNDEKELRKALKGKDTVFHVASKVAMWGSYQDFYKTNVLGTKALVKIAQQEGVRRFIYTSTPSVVFESDSLEGADETLPYPKKSYSKYAKTKAIAEEFVLGENSETFKTIALRPHLIFGPGDQNLIPRLVQAAKKKKLKIIGNADNKVDVIYVENAADAHICALKALIERPEKCSGKAFFIGQGPVELWPFINSILKRYELEPIKKSISFKKAFFIGAIIEMFLTILRINNIHPPMTRFVALQLAKSHYFSHKRAKDCIDWTPKISVEEGLSRLTL